MAAPRRPLLPRFEVIRRGARALPPGWVFFAALFAAQVGHLGEHISKTITGSGVLGPAFDSEFSHLAFNSLIALGAALTALRAPSNPWVAPLLLLALLHVAEHVYIYFTFLGTGIANGPGLLARDGALRVLPLGRIDLHNAYNGLEAVLITLGFSYEIDLMLEKIGQKEAEVAGAT